MSIEDETKEILSRVDTLIEALQAVDALALDVDQVTRHLDEIDNVNLEVNQFKAKYSGLWTKCGGHDRWYRVLIIDQNLRRREMRLQALATRKNAEAIENQRQKEHIRGSWFQFGSMLLAAVGAFSAFRSSEYSREGQEMAKVAASEAREAARLSARPIVKVTPAGLSSAHRLSLLLNNVGRNPATDVVVKYAVVFDNNPASTDVKDVVPFGNGLLPGMPVAYLANPDIRGARLQQRAVLLIKLHYRDRLFNKATPFEEEFYFRLRPENGRYRVIEPINPEEYQAVKIVRQSLNSEMANWLSK